MYSIKIKSTIDGKGVSDSKGDAHNTVVPTETHLFEGNEVIYRKVRLEDAADLRKLEDDLLEHYGAFRFISNKKEEYPCEVAVVTICDGDKCIYFVVKCDNIFITNDLGSTVDVITLSNP